MAEENAFLSSPADPALVIQLKPGDGGLHCLLWNLLETSQPV